MMLKLTMMTMLIVILPLAVVVFAQICIACLCVLSITFHQFLRMYYEQRFGARLHHSRQPGCLDPFEVGRYILEIPAATIKLSQSSFSNNPKYKYHHDHQIPRIYYDQTM